MRAIAITFGRLVGIASLLFSGTVFFGSLVGVGDSAATDTPWLVAALACVSMTGIGGSVLFLLSFDGSARFRTRGRRLLGWVGMLICAVMPTSLIYLIVPLVVLGGITLFLDPVEGAPRRRGRHMATSA